MREPQLVILVGHRLAYRAEHGGAGRRDLQATFQHMLEHRLATDFSDQLAGQAPGVQPGWDGENDRGGLILWIDRIRLAQFGESRPSG